MCPAAVSAARPHLYRSSFQQRLPRFVSPLEKNTAKKTERKKKKKNKRAKKDERGTIGSATSVSNRLGLAACLFLLCLCSFQIFPFSFLSALVISSVCDGFSTLI
jgi:hypothetical protein